MGLNIPSIKPKQAVKALKKAGFVKARQTGSHLIMKNPDTGKIVPVPMHAKALKRSLLFAIIQESGLPTKEFLKFLKK